MDMEKAGIVICLTIVIVIGINAVILVSLRRGNEASQVDLLRRAAGRARRPWGKEDDELLELSKLVAGLKRDGPEDDQGTGREGQIDQEKKE